MEWTIEQREQAADQLNRIGWSPEYWDSYHPERREREIASVVTGSGVLIPAHKLVDTFCKLTAALSENERLRSQLAKDDTQMGELAVGGASSENQVRRLIEAINWACGCGDSDFNPYDGNSIKPRYFWRGELVKKAGLAWCHKTGKYTLPAPPSGEQAAKPKKLTLTEAARIASGKDMQPPSKPIRFAAVPVGNQERRDEEGI